MEVPNLSTKDFEGNDVASFVTCGTCDHLDIRIPTIKINSSTTIHSL